jgi:hypothetical protein
MEQLDVQDYIERSHPKSLRLRVRSLTASVNCIAYLDHLPNLPSNALGELDV